MVNLAISDFIDAIFVNSFTAVGKILDFFDFLSHIKILKHTKGIMNGENFFSKIPGFCKFIGTVCLLSCGAGIISMLSLSLNRFLYILKS